MGYNVIGMHNRRGFTMVELLLVMGIIVVMAGVVSYLSITGNLKKGRDAKRQADLESIRAALEVYRSNAGSYPNRTIDNLSTDLNTTYIQPFPTDSISTQKYFYVGTGVCAGGGCPGYQLCAKLEGTVQTPACAANLCGGPGVFCNYSTLNP